MAADDQRIRNGQGGYNCGVYVDPQNPDVVYTLNTASYKSTDGGKTFTGFKGAPGGDDPQQMWIDPTNGQRILFGYDQGAIVSLDGGGTWSSWYNQSTDQIYHLSVDNSVPYWVYGTQQDAGAIRTRIRGNLGAITPLDWNPVSGWEWGTIVPDPLDPNTVYASGSGILKISYPSEQWINVSPAQDASRQLRTTSDQPLVFAPWNKHMLIAGVPVGVDDDRRRRALDVDQPRSRRASRRAASAERRSADWRCHSIDARLDGRNGHDLGRHQQWADQGDARRRQDVVRREHLRNSERAARGSALRRAVALRRRRSVRRARIYTGSATTRRTSSARATRASRGRASPRASRRASRVAASGASCGAIPCGAGLLFAGTESDMYVSFDDGDHWQSLQLDLPTTSYRDIALKDNDIVVSTYGRGFWSLDDYSMLRQVSSSVVSEAAHLFKPGDVVRTRRNVGADTPFPPEVPHALNPAQGAQLDYWLAQAPRGDITLDVLDASGALVRHMSSAAITPVTEAARPPEPNFWIETPKPLPTNVGGNRTNWDLRYDSPSSFTHSFEINANPGLTPASPEGPVAIPGTYTLKLTVDGKSYTQTVAIKPDPHSPATVAAITAQHALQMKLVQGIDASYQGHRMAQALRDTLRAAANNAGDGAAIVNRLAAQLDTIAGIGGGGRGRGRGGQGGTPNFQTLNGAMVAQLNTQDLGDLAPTSSALAAFGASCRDLAKTVAAWQKVTAELTAINSNLRSGGGRSVAEIPAGTMKPPVC